MNTKIPPAMLEAIWEEPGLIAACCGPERNRLTGEFVKLVLEKPIRRIYFCGSGSVANTGMILKQAAEKWLGVEASWEYSGWFQHHGSFNASGKYRPEEVLLICPAESGLTKGPVEAARRAQKMGISCVCTVQSKDSILADCSDVTIVKPSGKERNLPSAKGYSIGLLTLLLCLMDSAKAKGSLGEKEYQALNESLESLGDSCEAIAEKTLRWFDRWQYPVMRAPFYRIIGYGANYGTAVEGALKFSESHKRLTVAYELEEFLHGPLGTVQNGDMVFFLFGEEGLEKERMRHLYRQMKTITPYCVAVGPSELPEGNSMNLPFALTGGEFWNTVELVVPLQVLSCQIAECLGLDTTQGMNADAKAAMVPSFFRQNNNR